MRNSQLASETIKEWQARLRQHLADERAAEAAAHIAREERLRARGRKAALAGTKRLDAAAQRWMRVLPRGLAIQQAVFEKGDAAFRMRALGMTYAQIGARLGGISAHRASQIASRAERRRNSRDRRSPIERYFDQTPLYCDANAR